MKISDEYRLQQGCVKWFRLQYPQCLCYSCPNEATYKNTTYFLNIGLLKGVADLTIVLPNKILFVEMKSKTGRMSLEQKEFRDKVQYLGFEYHVIKTFEEFKIMIDNEMKDK